MTYAYCFIFLASTLTTVINGQPTVVGSVIYQYGNNDNVGGSQNNNPPPKSSAIRQVADFLRSAKGCAWALYAWVIVIMVVAA